MESTKFAPAERAMHDELWEAHWRIRDYDMVQRVIDAVPNIVMVLNRQRQIVFCNDRLLRIIGVEADDRVIGKRPGELLDCVHASKTEGGCGTTEYCEFCGAVIAILQSQAGLADTRECRITVHTNDGDQSMDLRVTATPLQIESGLFTFLTIIDISDEKRRNVLERVFFHDVLNTASVIKNSAEILASEQDRQHYQEFATILPTVADRLIDEIQAQRQLLRAESGELSVNLMELHTRPTVIRAMEQAKGHITAPGMRIELQEPIFEAVYASDPVILHRVLGNMLKNALEASDRDAVIRLGCQETEDGWIRFFVKNPGVLDKAVQMQIFQRSFSTKGVNRGIGSYSMKLLTERYLHGRIGFTSTTQDGVEFFIVIPRLV
jgi:signal transduction histidine kinase